MRICFELYLNDFGFWKQKQFIFQNVNYLNQFMSTKKENKLAYKQMKFRVGIYQIKNLQNNKLFLKTSLDLDRAYNTDLFQLKFGNHKNNELQQDWNTFGLNNFEFALFDELKTEASATELEIKNDLKELIELHRFDLIKNGISLY